MVDNIGRGLGAPVNTCQQCQIWQSEYGSRMVALAVGGVGGREILYLGRNDMLYSYLGCFGGPGGAGESRRASGNAFQKSAFQIRQVVPVGLARAVFAAGLVGVGFSRKKVCI